ncbi:beta-galactosidase GalA [Paenibacillus sp. RC67]|uniref:beta-galactosidase GalA n=1 Tax=Paenibacillus sp. RC67 TaxID=3039392 RepID=UPI0024AE07BD|nr:beta-galactosidase GalA [Paenibacillus sp. RC67]
MSVLTRVKESFDSGWFFHKGDIAIPYAVKAGMTKGLTDCGKKEDGEWLDIAYVDKEADQSTLPKDWKSVQIPHDWVVEQNYVNDPSIGSRPGSHGYLPTGVGFYRKLFHIPQEDLGRKISIHFDGIMGVSTVWMNGHLLGTHRSGYTGFHYDITDIVRYGDEGANVILVKADTTTYEGWWYEGSGIYRHVWLQKTDPLHVAQWGTYITTPEVSDESASVVVRTTVQNDSESDRTCEIVSTIVDSQGVVIASLSQEVTVPWNSSTELTQSLTVPTPQRWTLENPYLYKMLTDIRQNGELVDQYETTFGIRTILFTREGFYLNGVRTLLKGTCNHQDFAGVGVALPDRLIEYKIELLKEMGCNAYRSAHHPPTPELLDICDRLGILVMDENRKLDSTPEGIANLTSMLVRDRNHPSIIIWSMENEEILEGTIMGARIVRSLVNVTRRIDPTRPTLAAMNHGWNGGGYSEQVDIVGYNYGQRRGQDVSDYEKYPNRIMLASESASSTTTRGVYASDKVRGYCPAYDGVQMPGWGYSVENAWKDAVAYPFLQGIFLWTGFDYRGEPTPYAWPCINSHFGIMDICGFPKDVYYYLKSVWTEDPMIHVLPHWNWLGKQGEPIDVWVYSNGDSVELTLNGNSLGRKPMNKNGHLEWQVPYEPGELVARAYIGEQEIAVKEVATTYEAYQIHLKCDRSSIHADGKDVAIVTVTIQDDKGRIVPIADNEVVFSIEGAGTILGVGNGNPSSHEPDKAKRRRAFNGYCLALVQSNGEVGEVVLHAESTGLCSAELKIETNVGD